MVAFSPTGKAINGRFPFSVSDSSRYYIARSGQLRTFTAEKDGSSTGQIGMMEHGFSAQPGDYSLQLTHGIGQFLGRPVNGNFGNPDFCPGSGNGPAC